MNLSDQGLQLLIAREDKRNAVYLDSKGIPSVGVGHTGPEVVMGDVWTDEQVEAAFRRDLAKFEDAVNESINDDVTLEQYEFDALVSFAWNVGASGEEHSTLAKRINAGDEMAFQEFDRWHIPPEITSRRNGEKMQFRGLAFEARIA